jgi:ABC-2 type transport system ATP-binding protein
MINADNVTVTFRKGLLKKKIVALDKFSLQVNQGDIYALLGPNGAGKSTAMYCFLGLIKPNQGTVSVLNETPEPGAKLFERIAYLPEEPHYHLYLTVEEAVRYYNALYTEPASQSAIDAAIDKVGLNDYKDLKMSKCSKGMKQKVGIAVCLLKRPELMFLDEPTRGLDPLMVKEFRDILLELNQQGTTIILNSHLLSEIEMICNRVAIVNKGKVKLQDNLKNLMHYDFEHYSVEFDITDTIPEYVTQIIKTAKSITGKIPVDRNLDFFKFAQEKQIKVYDCSLKRQSLEDVFLDVLKGD